MMRLVLILKKIRERIKLNIISKIIDETSYISETRKNFYKLMIEGRKEKIIDKAIERFK